MSKNQHKRTKTQPVQSTYIDHTTNKYMRNNVITEEQDEYIQTERHNQQELLQIESIFIGDKASNQVKELTNEEMNSLKACFEKYSSTKTIKKPPRSRLNASGIREILPTQPEIDVTLSQKELNQLFIEAGIPLHKQTLNHISTALSKNNKGKGITFKDLQELFKSPNAIQESYADYQEIFKVYDRKNRGYFDYEDYRFMCEGIGKRLTQGQIRQAFNRMDRQGLNRITFRQFLLIMKGIY